MFKVANLIALLLILIVVPARAQQTSTVGAPALFAPDVLFCACGDGALRVINPGLGRGCPLVPGDVLDLRVFGHRELDGRMTVDARGRIELPLLGEELEVACRDAGEAQKEITARYRAAGKNYKLSARIADRPERPPRVATRFDEHAKRTFIRASNFNFVEARLQFGVETSEDSSPVEMSFTVFDENGEYRACGDLTCQNPLLVRLGDGRRIALYAVYTVNLLGGPDGLTRLTVSVPRADFKRLAAARTAEMKLGSRAFSLKPQHLAALREVAERITPHRNPGVPAAR